jgi:hypothetical protein
LIRVGNFAARQLEAALMQSLRTPRFNILLVT